MKRRWRSKEMEGVAEMTDTDTGICLGKDLQMDMEWVEAKLARDRDQTRTRLQAAWDARDSGKRKQRAERFVELILIL